MYRLLDIYNYTYTLRTDRAFALHSLFYERKIHVYIHENKHEVLHKFQYVIFSMNKYNYSECGINVRLLE